MPRKKKEVVPEVPPPKKKLHPYMVPAFLGALVLASIYLTTFADFRALEYTLDKTIEAPKRKELDKDEYNRRMLALAQIFPTPIDPAATTTPATPYTTATSTNTLSVATKMRAWPVATPYPRAGALLPFNRIIAYYGNFYSTRMGVLGEYPEEQMLDMLRKEAAAWEAADPTTPVVPAIHYIASTAQGSAGEDGTYRLRMPDTQIDHALALADKLTNGIVFLDLQVGLSSVQKEVPVLEKYLSMPNVHLGIDPEFAMHDGRKPGKYIGTLDAADVNWTIEYLSRLVREHDLPPKVLIVHRFTYDMLTNAERIHPTPEVQVVIHMDGWGTPEKKKGTYQHVIIPEPVQFTGFKLFYKNDLKPPPSGLLTPAELPKLTPVPIYIQYQ